MISIIYKTVSGLYGFFIVLFNFKGFAMIHKLSNCFKDLEGYNKVFRDLQGYLNFQDPNHSPYACRNFANFSNTFVRISNGSHDFQCNAVHDFKWFPGFRRLPECPKISKSHNIYIIPNIPMRSNLSNIAKEFHTLINIEHAGFQIVFKSSKVANDFSIILLTSFHVSISMISKSLPGFA